MPLPDYHGNSIVNLMASIETALGGRNDYVPLATLDLEQLAAARTVVLLVVDGLGYGYLKDRGEQTNLARGARAPLTTVFPATTAAAVTTFLTASAPQQHGHTGWFTYFEEVQNVVAGLPCKVRGSGAPISSSKLGKLFGGQPLFQRSTRSNFVLSPESIAFSTFNRQFSGGAEIVPYGNLREMFDYLAAICQRKSRNYVYAYWPELDRLGHAYGMHSREAHRHLLDFDKALAGFVRVNAGNDTLLLTTADHGFVDSGPDHCIWLHDYADLARMLAQPLCGEPRAAYCYVHPQYRDEFTVEVGSALEGAMQVVASANLIEQGYFGLGEPHPALHRRIGDFTLLAQKAYSIKDSVEGERQYMQIGVHGGNSDAELYVPLVVTEM
jgi:hypothetical protein